MRGRAERPTLISRRADARVSWVLPSPDRDSDITSSPAGHPAGLAPATQCEVAPVTPLTTPGGMGYCNPGTLPRPRGLIPDASRATGTYLRRRLFVLTWRNRWLHSVYILGRHYSI